MDPATCELHLSAGLRAGREATCGPAFRPKVDYKREESAVKAAGSLNRRGDRRNVLEASIYQIVEHPVRTV